MSSKYLHNKERWLSWWRVYGEEKAKRSRSWIHRPNFNEELAEFTGIMLGDGSITRYQVVVSLDAVTDGQYIYFVADLFRKLFRVPVGFVRRKNSRAIDIKVSRRELVEFANQELELRIGNKLDQGLNIPSWIMKKQDLQLACLRGLIDTDGCIFYERHRIKDKIYSYPRLNLRSASPELLLSAQKIFQNLNLSGIMRSDRSLQLESKEDILSYFALVGTSNQKHLRRFNDQ